MFECDEVGATPDADVTEIRLTKREPRIVFASAGTFTVSLALDDGQRATLTDGLLAVTGRCSKPPRLVIE